MPATQRTKKAETSTSKRTAQLTASREESDRHWNEVVEPQKRREFAERLNRAWAEAEKAQAPLKMHDVAAAVREASGKPFTAQLLRRWRGGVVRPDRWREELLDALGAILDLGEEGGAWLRFGNNVFNVSGVPPLTVQPLPPGLYPAPYLSARGAVVFVAIDRGSRFRFSSTASRVSEPLLGELRERLLPLGVHRAPWAPYGNAERGIVLLAIDGKHRLVAQAEAADPFEARALTATLATKLKHAEGRNE